VFADDAEAIRALVAVDYQGDVADKPSTHAMEIWIGDRCVKRSTDVSVCAPHCANDLAAFVIGAAGAVQRRQRGVSLAVVQPPPLPQDEVHFVHSLACLVRSRRASMRSLEDTSRSSAEVALAGRGRMSQLGTDPGVHLHRGDSRLMPSPQILARGHHQVGGPTNQLEIVQKIC
jgi:hypothetical protein